MSEELPNGWVTARLSSVVDVLDGRRVPVNAQERAARPGTVPYYGASGQVGWIDDYLFDEDLILLGEDGVQFFDPVKTKAYLVSGKTWVNNHAHVLRAREGVIDRRLLCHYLNYFSYEGFANGTTRLKLTQGAMNEIPIPLPPYAEQLRIIEALENHLSRLDMSESLLRNAASHFYLHTRAVYTSAVEGRLHSYPADEIDVVANFPSIRRQVWDEIKTHSSYKEPTAPNLEFRPCLPDGWQLFSLEAITHPVRTIRYGILMPRVTEGEVPYVEVKDLLGNTLLGRSLNKTSRDLDEQFAAARISVGDVVLAVRGSYDRSAVVPAELTGANLSRDVVRLAPLNGLTPEYLHLYLQSAFAQQYFARHARGVAVKGVNISSLRELPVAVPPLMLQKAIVEAVESQLNGVSRLKNEVIRSTERAKHLRRSLLAMAYTGLLGPQDSTDEPASEILGRIEAERRKQPKAARAGKSTTSIKTSLQPRHTPIAHVGIQEELQL